MTRVPCSARIVWTDGVAAMVAWASTRVTARVIEQKG